MPLFRWKTNIWFAFQWNSSVKYQAIEMRQQQQQPNYTFFSRWLLLLIKCDFDTMLKLTANQS